MPIQQHPIPQDVAGYKFRLIGEMTIKQFIWLAGGIIVGLLVYSSPLPFFFKYPLAVIAVALGGGIAFVPIEGRPMDKWLIAFIKSVYSPTQFVWQKSHEETTASVSPQKVATPVQTPTSFPPARHIPVVPTAVIQTPPSAPKPITPAPAPIMAPKVAVPVTASSPITPRPTIPTTPTPAPKPTVTVPPVVVPATPSIPKPSAAPQATPVPAESRLPIPFTPTTPNTLVGMTLTPEGKILESTLIEIKSKGTTIRATKSNQLGQFLFAKPLDSGLYQIICEKPGFLFDIYSIELTNQIVKPLKLQAKSNA